jgi:WD40 repeat protein
VYAAPEGGEIKLWFIGTEGGPPSPISGATGRASGWSPRGDAIVAVRAADDIAHLHFKSASGEVVREPIAIGPVSLPTALAWSPDGTHIGMVNLPGRAAAEVWLLRVSDGHLRKLTEFAAPVELEGVDWTPDGKALLVGRTEYETEVVRLRDYRESRSRSFRLKAEATENYSIATARDSSGGAAVCQSV